MAPPNYITNTTAHDQQTLEAEPEADPRDDRHLARVQQVLRVSVVVYR